MTLSSTPTLQKVTSKGNSTTQPIDVGSLKIGGTEIITNDKRIKTQTTDTSEIVKIKGFGGTPFSPVWSDITIKSSSVNMFEGSGDLHIADGQTYGEWESVIFDVKNSPPISTDSTTWSVVAIQQKLVPNVTGTKIILSYKLWDTDEPTEWTALTDNLIKKDFQSEHHPETSIYGRYLRIKIRLERSLTNDRSPIITYGFISILVNRLISANLEWGGNIGIRSILDAKTSLLLGQTSNNLLLCDIYNGSRAILLRGFTGGNQLLELESFGTYTGNCIRLNSQARNSIPFLSCQYGDANNIKLETFGTGKTLNMRSWGPGDILFLEENSTGNLINSNKGFRIGSNGEVILNTTTGTVKQIVVVNNDVDSVQAVVQSDGNPQLQILKGGVFTTISSKQINFDGTNILQYNTTNSRFEFNDKLYINGNVEGSSFTGIGVSDLPAHTSSHNHSDLTGTHNLTTDIVHQNITGAGTNDHSAIDSHIGNTSNPHSVTLAQVGGLKDWVTAPATKTSIGTAGDIAYSRTDVDNGFLYVCTGTDEWQRVAISSWT